MDIFDSILFKYQIDLFNTILSTMNSCKLKHFGFLSNILRNKQTLFIEYTTYFAYNFSLEIYIPSTCILVVVVRRCE